MDVDSQTGQRRSHTSDRSGKKKHKSKSKSKSKSKGRAKSKDREGTHPLFVN